MTLNYTSLDASRKEIRLLTIEPEEDYDSQLRGSFHVVSLLGSSKLDYKALSYVWGNSQERQEIVVEGCVISVTSNLASCLRGMRQALPKERYVVWCDFICINQTDPDEKHHQIMLMGEVYRCAEYVVAWLGSLTPDISAAIRAFARKEEKHISTGPSWLSDEKTLSASKVTLTHAQKDELSKIHAWGGTVEIVNSPYWSRVWTFQEWFLPKKRPVCLCGHILFDLWEVRPPLQEFFDLMLQDGDDDEAKDTYSAYLDDLLDRISQNMKANYPLDLIMADDETRIPLTKGEFDVATVLSMTASRVCSEPLDRIYALYATTPSLSHKYPPNYTKSLYQVFWETTAFSLSSELGTDIFADFGLLRNPASPSWTLDFSVSSEAYSTACGHMNLKYGIDESLWLGGMAELPQFDDRLRALRLHARTFGFVSLFGPIIPEYGIKGLREQSREITEEHGGTNSSKLVRYFLDVIYDLYDAACFSDVSIDRSEFGVMIEYTDLSSSVGDGFNSVVKEALSKGGTKDKSLFFLKDRDQHVSIGLASGAIRDGDMVVSAYGIDQLFVVRQDSQDSATDEAPFKIIDLAFIAGFEKHKSSKAPRRSLVRTFKDVAWKKIVVY
ncbi:hypothetical protein PV08_08348 [Exophiala spinifera]|uniref:Heterokaryon incompatibility domain-containing protein n=1 Tax=Exophiala spinifera TaxID=91928 RepID=A0A0D1YDQ1_9EURO|nr:uncharacterized protein PV08_08348 [Exophiala spinifera]KIW13161.1 hypothetical protein PV08_08348 [Exophiala spinifera]